MQGHGPDPVEQLEGSVITELGPEPFTMPARYAPVPWSNLKDYSIPYVPAPDWSKALCKGMDQEMFFGVEHDWDGMTHDYAVVRVVPRVEREEFVNAGVILSCHRSGFLQAAIALENAAAYERLHPELGAVVTA